MANGIDSQYTGIGRVPIVQEDTTSIWDAIVPLAQMAKADKARQEKLKLDYAALQQKRDADDDLNQYRQDSLDQQSVYQKGQLDIAQERNQITKMEFEKKQRDEREAEDLAVASTATDWKDQVSELRKLALSTGKESYNARADLIEKDGVVKDGMQPLKDNLMQEDNPYKIREYLKREGGNLNKYFPSAYKMLDSKATQLESKYDVSEREILNSDIYKASVQEINTQMGQPGMLKAKKDGTKYTFTEYTNALQQAKFQTQDVMQAPQREAGIMPIGDDDMDKIWNNPEAREAYFANPLDDTKSIMKKFGMIEDKEGDKKLSGDDDKKPPIKDPTISELESKISAYEEAGMTGLKGYAEVKKELKLKESELNRKTIDDRIKDLAMRTGESEDSIRKNMLRQTRGKLYQISPSAAFFTDLTLKK